MPKLKSQESRDFEQISPAYRALRQGSAEAYEIARALEAGRGTASSLSERLRALSRDLNIAARGLAQEHGVRHVKK